MIHCFQLLFYQRGSCFKIFQIKLYLFSHHIQTVLMGVHLAASNLMLLLFVMVDSGTLFSCVISDLICRCSDFSPMDVLVPAHNLNFTSTVVDLVIQYPTSSYMWGINNGLSEDSFIEQDNSTKWIERQKTWQSRSAIKRKRILYRKTNHWIALYFRSRGLLSIHLYLLQQNLILYYAGSFQ